MNVNPADSRPREPTLPTPRLPTWLTEDPSRCPVLVTGASSGIGAAFARALGERGHPLVLVARSRPDLERLAAALPVDASVVVADLTSGDGLDHVERVLAGTRPPVRLLVNNAGSATFGDLGGQRPDALDTSVLLNVLAPTRLISLALRTMPPGSGIINISSTAAGRHDPRIAAYAASKAYLEALSRAAREEARTRHIEVTVVRPGRTRTAFHERAGEDTTGLPDHRWQCAPTVVDAALRAHARREPEVTVASWSTAGDRIASTC